MPVPIPATDSLAARRQQLLQQLAALGDLCPGSLVPSFRRCGKPNCRCNAPDHPGPRWLLAHHVHGKTRTRTIPPDQLDATRAQTAECQSLRGLVAELIDVSDQVCQARLEAGGEYTPGDAEKPCGQAFARALEGVVKLRYFALRKIQDMGSEPANEYSIWWLTVSEIS